MNEIERKCDDWLSGYIEYTQDFEPPKPYQKWMGILTLAVAAGHRVWLQEANLKIWPNLYVVLVGPSGIGKGQAMREALPFLQATGTKISPDKITIPKLTKVLSDSAINDAEIGLYTPYLIWAEELPSFLGLDAYRSGKLADLTTLYDCAERWESGTKHQGDDVISQPYICMGAGSTTSGIFDVLPPQSVGQGFTSRLLYIHAGGYTRRVAEKPWTEDFHGKLRKALLHDIQIISKIRGAMKFSDLARILWNDYYMNRPLPPEEYGDERMQGYAARKPFYAKKLALLLALSEAPPPGSVHSMVVEAHHIERALTLLEDVDKSMVEVYGEMVNSTSISHYSKVVRFLLKELGMEAQRSTLRRKFAYALDEVDFDKTMKSLEDMGIIESRWEKGYHNKVRRLYKLIDSNAAVYSLAKGEK